MSRDLRASRRPHEEETAPGSLVVVILDTSPVLWAGRYGDGRVASDSVSFIEYIEAATVFINAHLLLQKGNRVAVIANHSDSRCEFLYVADDDSDGGSGHGNVASVESTDGKYERLGRVDQTVKERLERLAGDSVDDKDAPSPLSFSQLARSLSRALCHINRVTAKLPVGVTLQSRILVMTIAADIPSQYIMLMNCIFAAQKCGVAIDSLVLSKGDSGFLQQAADLTRGVYMKVSDEHNLLQYLMTVFLPDQRTRALLSHPRLREVDYRAACFCAGHKNIIIDTGYVCSVCLSLFCKKTSICSTCRTKFKTISAVPPQQLAPK